ncbi:MAG: hypothetical protein C4K49_12555 [Candidatus Thorarchaeota archaeon]|nr:MAG: hypothetical protein C4K49_12555 [Candidatus Thorarchaeota archaeon]
MIGVKAVGGYDIPLNEFEFRKYLKRGGRTERVQNEVVRIVAEFGEFLRTQRDGRTLERAQPTDLEQFVEQVERESEGSAKTHLWALRYYFAFSEMKEMERLTAQLREGMITRPPFRLAKFLGVKPDFITILASVGIRSADEMLNVGRTAKARETLSRQIGVPSETILELVKMSDLSRIFGVKAIRARLYYDAGVDTVEKMAQWDPKELRSMLIAFVERTRFKGIAPLPKELEFTVAAARKLAKLVEY